MSTVTERRCVPRPLAAGDSIEALTALLHRAYAPLGARGLNFSAVDQSPAVTRERLDGQQGLVVEDAGGALIGTVTVGGPADLALRPGWRRCAWYLRRDTAHMNQLAVEPSRQGRGLGRALVAAAEDWARAQGLRHMALDTAEPAAELRSRYAAAGYAEVGRVQWPGKTYRTVVMAKALGDGAPPSPSDPEHRAALVRALWAHVQARDWGAMGASFAPAATLHWPCSGERFDGADAIVRVNAVYPEGWRAQLREAEPLADGRVCALVEVDHDRARFFCNGRYGFDGERIVHAVEHWADAAPPPAWRTAERLGAGYARDADAGVT